MRISGLLMFLFCGLASLCGASDSARQSSFPSVTADSFGSDQFVAWTARDDSIKLQISNSEDRRPESRDGDTTCYTMHIFAMKREGADSDVTEPYRQFTCRRASKYGVRKVDEPDRDRSR